MTGEMQWFWIGLALVVGGAAMAGIVFVHRPKTQ
jgi:hypothetical protein